ncbi:TonB-dependent receptor [Cyclobacterium sp. 1_MG-2023]|uniref:TonB-dependent receptor n=1 Tax=Cyclobacterium sp. 1_MG-2023 TaxID=3062681 RepID=UPI0026E3EC24|nr:TonB-dependent receptor [Cyclobacterium sp. 1_MG-2023]MDO6436628.1 TonB-dependent receptor [Cyclobacterium sp. 1_MG-2023]
MKHIVTVLLLLCLYGSALAQNTFTVTIQDKESKEALFGVSVYFPQLEKGASSDINGKVAIDEIPDGVYTVLVTHLGYESMELEQSFPMEGELNLWMGHAHEEMEEVLVTSTRSGRTIEDVPTRVEVIAGEELAEKGNMKPGDIRMLLNESTGIQTQQTSATSYNSSIRIQGLDGKYTQLLRDGLPLYSGYSGGLSLMQIAPLDLKQVEVIKGASSTLYGGGAIAGLVNLISKTPGEDRELNFMVNGTSALGLDLSGFYSERYGKIGTTVFASYNKGTAYDPAGIGLTAIPEFERYTINPRMFWYLDEATEINLGFNFTTEDRLGGNMDYIEGKTASGYFESNETDRLSTQFDATHRFSDHSRIQVKNSISFFDRSIAIPDYIFSGKQVSSFSEINYVTFGKKMEWIVGGNLWTEKFDQRQGDPENDLGFSNTTTGAFVQNTWNMATQWTLETGLRGDYQSQYGSYLLPRFSLLFEPNESLTFRTGGGLGYKTPTQFTEDTERLHFRNILPIDFSETSAERSTGINLDVNYKWQVSGDLSLSTNALLFYTQIDDPMLLQSNNNGMYAFTQPSGYINTQGLEANMKWTYHDFKLFVGYTYADVKEHYDNEATEYPLVAKHRLNNVLMYEKHGDFWIGLEAYYFSPQKLSDGSTGKSYWIMGIMSEKKIGKYFSLFLNFENMLDTRQTRFDTIYTGNISDPQFRDIYAPVDGFVVNGGFKLSL